MDVWRALLPEEVAGAQAIHDQRRAIQRMRDIAALEWDEISMRTRLPVASVKRLYERQGVGMAPIERYLRDPGQLMACRTNYWVLISLETLFPPNPWFEFSL